MTHPPAVGNGEVSVELADGVVTLRWPETGVAFGPIRAAATTGGSELDSRGPGSWVVEPASSAGRAGTTARWTTTDEQVSFRVHVPERGSTVVVDAEVRAAAPMEIDALVPIDGPTDLRYDRRLVDGYESWSYSGVRGPEPGVSFWNAAYVDRDDRAVAFQALDAARLCTCIANDGSRLRVECGAAPASIAVPGTWGYRTGASPPMALPLDSGARLASAPIAVAAGRSPTALVEQLADLAASAMSARRWTGDPPRGWESWYQYGLFVSADDVLANARLLRERYGHRPGFDLVQLDDGWQRTYGAWWPNERFPDDLGDLVRELRELGCRPGLWIAPFRVQPDAPGVGTDHAGWCIRASDGSPVLDERHNAWALDASNPDAVRWIHELGTQVREWGFEMVKVDFCFLGAVHGGRHDRHVTGVEALRRGFGALVDALGDDVYVLGCGMLELPAVGLCHGNRVGHDLAMPRAHQELGHPVDEGWRGFTGIQAAARNVAARWAQAARWYEVDPDVVMAWGSDGADPAGYSTEEARTLTTLAVVCGGPFLLADGLASLDEPGRTVLEHAPILDLLGDEPFRPDDIFQRYDDTSIPEHAYVRGPGIPSVWRTVRGGRTVTAVFNWGDTDLRWDVPAELRDVVERWTGTTVADVLPVPAHGVRVLVS